jgi:phage-related minor tail protein
MGILKQESDKIIATFKQQEESKQKYMEGVKKISEAEQRRLELNIALGDNAAEIDTQMQMYNATREYGLKIGSEEYRQLEEQINAQKTAAAGIKELERARANEAEQARKASEAQKQWNNQLTYAFKDAIMNSKNLGDALSNLANRVQNMLVNKALDSLLGGLMGGFAKGAAFQAGGVTAFASGGVVNSPTTFPMRGGVGLMGEAGAEAIMPLTRTSNGDLGVKAVGGGSTVIAPNITIHVSGGTREQNDDAGRKVSAAVKQAIDDSVISVILREKRPGGVLNAA